MDYRGVEKEDSGIIPPAVPTVRSAIFKGILLCGFGALIPLLMDGGDDLKILEYLFSIGLILYGLYFLTRVPSAIKLDQQGVTTSGAVIKKWIRGRRNPMHFIAYEFLDGQRARDTVSRSIYRKLASGSSVMVLYLPDNPSVSRLDFSKESIQETRVDTTKSEISQAQYGSAARAGLLVGGILGGAIGFISLWIIQSALQMFNVPPEYLTTLSENYLLLPAAFGLAGGVILAWKLMSART